MADPVETERVPASPAKAATRYEDDLYGWVQEQIALLRAGRFAELDAENVAEELSDVGDEQYDKLQSALEVLLKHMLKWDRQPQRRSASWEITMAAQRERMATVIRKNPRLKSRLSEAVEDGYRLARLDAAREMRVKPAALPATCPYDWASITTRPFERDEG